MELTILFGTASPKLVEYEFRKLDKEIEEARFDEVQVRRTFRNIVLQMTDYDMYESIFILVPVLGILIPKLCCFVPGW